MSEFVHKPFDTRRMFSGGAGLFIQFQDVVTPINLFAIIKLLITDVSFGIPINIIKDLSLLSLAEWYINRSFINPICSLDYEHQLSPKEADELLRKILQDKSIYDYSPRFNVGLMLDVYRYQKMNIPIYIYSPYPDPNIEYYCNKNFPDIRIQYLQGDLIQNIKKCDNNFTYIFSDIELVKQAVELLRGSYAHILLAEEYRYNYKDNFHIFKYDLDNLTYNNPFCIVGTTLTINSKTLANSLQILKMKGR